MDQSDADGRAALQAPEPRRAWRPDLVTTSASGSGGGLSLKALRKSMQVDQGPTHIEASIKKASGGLKVLSGPFTPAANTSIRSTVRAMGSIKQQRKALVEQRLPPPTRSTPLASSSTTPGRTLLGCTGRTPMGDLPVAQFPGPGRSRTRRGPAGFCPGHRRPPMLPVALGQCLQSRPGPSRSRGMLPLAEGRLGSGS
jgi:hypothetical protein